MNQALSFAVNDKLDRKRFAEFLYHLIQNHSRYQRNPDMLSYNIALDSGYGSGKSYFLNMFENMIHREEKFNIIHYDAWQADCFSDALTPIIHCLHKASYPEFIPRRTKEKVISALKHMSVTAAKLAAGSLGSIPGALAAAVIEGASNESDEPDYDKVQKSIEELKDSLSSLTAGRPLLFVVDELDRCNPLFAIKTFEILKHLMNVPNVIFLFAVDLQQIRAAVKKVYGMEIDADGYLCKLFDYTVIMPLAPKEKYIRNVFQRFGNDFCTYHPKLVTSIIQIIESHNDNSLRNIDTLLNAFFILWDFLVKKYNSFDAHILYFICLYLKFYYPDLFHRIFVDHTISSDDEKALESLRNAYPCVKRLIEIGTQIIDTNKAACAPGVSSFVSFSMVSSDSNGVYLIPQDFGGTPMRFEENHSINYLIFLEDLPRWESIKKMTYAQHLHHQLEMFSFSRPNDKKNPSSK